MKTWQCQSLADLELVQEILDEMGEGNHGHFVPEDGGDPGDSGFVPEPLSLHDLFDVPTDPLTQEHAEAVDLLFPDPVEPDSTQEDVDRPLRTPSPPQLSPVNLVCRREQELEELGAEIDLTCHEKMFTDSEDEGEGAPQNGGSGERDGFRLDCPEQPGQGCLSCHVHRCTMGDPTLMCSLCYMRLNSHCIYSPVSEPEEEEGDESSRERPRPSTSAQGVTQRPQKRQHADVLTDPPQLGAVCALLGPQEEPLDLSCKRSRPES
ncbi:E1A [Titi monkey adenovirus ECC-2011]|uniref:Early E1A protein n=1 Tax=titi monkey adenovirus 1 TaxID=3123084 RepID=G0ZAH1_9ADEN|nr:E1A [Titi monkey adenovirus ECC-2011]AEK98442.1 E1A [Titi monkey adenovirus ECC-2011]